MKMIVVSEAAFDAIVDRAKGEIIKAMKREFKERDIKGIDTEKLLTLYLCGMKGDIEKA